MQPSLLLRVQEPGRPVQEISLREGLVFGRHHDCDVVIVDSNTSTRHARICESSGELCIEDLGSTNKTGIVDGPVLEKGHRYPLAAGMQIFLGRVLLEVVGDTVEPPPSAEDLECTIQMSAPAEFAPPPPPPPDPVPVIAMSPAEEEARRQAEEDLLRQTEREAEAYLEEETRFREHAERRYTDELERDDFTGGTVAPAAPTPPSGEPDADSDWGEGFLKVEQQQQAQADVSAAVARATEVASDFMITEEDAVPDHVISELANSDQAETLCANPHGAGEIEGGLALCPRLIFSTEAYRRTEQVVFPDGDYSPGFVMGRAESATSPVHCPIPHRAISSIHARVFFDRGRFFLEDLGSKNGTYLGPELLAPKVPREIRSGMSIRLGSISALFVTDEMAEDSADPSRHRKALDLLEKMGRLTREQREEAEAQAPERGQHVGEMLLLDGALRVEEWVEAVERANVVMELDESLSGKRGRKRWILAAIAGALILAVAGLAIWSPPWLPW